MNMTLDEFQVCFEHIMKITPERLQNILIMHGVSGSYINENCFCRHPLKVLMANFPDHKGLSAKILQEAMKLGQDYIDRRAWLTWDPNEEDDPVISEENWRFLIDECQRVVDQTKRSNKNWVVRYVNVGWQNKTGVTTLEADNFRGLLSKLLPDTDYTLSIWKQKPQQEDPWWHLHIRCFHHDSPTGESYFIYKPTLKQYNAIRSGQGLEKVLSKR